MGESQPYSSSESFEGVYAAFAKFRERMITSSMDMDAARMPTGRPNIIAGQTRVFSIYSPDEEPYVFRASSLLKSIASGNGKSEKNGKPLSKRITEHFSQQENNHSFSRAIADGILDCLKEFADTYPEMIPALDALYATLGSEGTMLSVSACQNFLADAKRGDLNTANLPTHGKLPPYEFASIRGTSDKQGAEVQCTGMGFAQEIIHQAKIAAIELAETGADSYDVATVFETEQAATNSIQVESAALVKQIMERACTEFGVDE